MITYLPAFILTGVAISKQLKQDFPLPMAQLRTLNKPMVVNWYLMQLQSEDPSETPFVQAFQAKMQAEGSIPEHLFGALLAAVSGDSSDRVASPFCPPGGCNVPLSLSEIWAYGCWCTLAHPTQGHGQPQDQYDEVCKKLARCNRCVISDANDGGYKCDPQNDFFNTQLAWDPEAQGLRADCNIVNSNECGVHLCSCEGTFLSRVMDLLWDGVERIPELRHDNDAWDSDVCVTDVADTSDKFCCGFYPDRYPFTTLDAECCHGTAASQVFHLNLEVCCPDGSVQQLGDPCF